LHEKKQLSDVLPVTKMGKLLTFLLETRIETQLSNFGRSAAVRVYSFI